MDTLKGSDMNLDELRAEAQRAYLDFEIEADGHTLKLLSPLRLSKANRQKLMDLFSDANDSTDQDALLESVITLVSESAATARKLIELTKGDLPTRALMISKYQETVAVGEASDSPN